MRWSIGGGRGCFPWSGNLTDWNFVVVGARMSGDVEVWDGPFRYFLLLCLLLLLAGNSNSSSRHHCVRICAKKLETGGGTSSNTQMRIISVFGANEMENFDNTV